MGVDIRALRQIKLMKATEAYDDELAGVCVRLINDRLFVDRSDGLPHGYYDFTDANLTLSFSYSGYNAWRAHLSRMICWSKPKQVWRGRVKPIAFAELINFSDCEGFIGPKTSAKLVGDFRMHRARAAEYIEYRHRDEHSDDFLARYDALTEIFEAAREGAVRFG